MKLSTKHLTSKRSKGFTLVELLVVIAIIATLGGVSYGPIMKQIGNADVTIATKVCKDLEAAIFAYQDKYGSLPTTSTSYPNDDLLFKTDNSAFLDTLSGENTDTNDNAINFLEGFDQAKDGKDGLIYTGDKITSLVDKWGNPYSIMLDYDADGKIEVSTLLPTPTGSEYVDDRRNDVAIASPGRDGLFDGKKDSRSW